MNTYNEILERILTGPLKKDGKYNSSRLSEKWLTENGFGDVLKYVLDNTEVISDRTIGQRFWAFERLPVPLCECGKPVIRSGTEWSEYCCQQCALHSVKRHQKISESWKKTDKTAANIKRSQSMIEKYGVAFNLQREDVKETLRKSPLSPDIDQKLSDWDWMNTEYVVKNRSAVDIAEELGVYYGTVIERCKIHGFEIKQRSNYSLEETKLVDHFREYNVIQNCRSTIPPYELDLFFPDYKVAVEINGLYWHSSPEKQGKHLEKLELCINNGIDLLQFTDLEVNTKFSIVTSMISNRLHLSNKINGRDTKIGLVSTSDTRLFLETNHLNGYVNSAINIGLFYRDELVMIGTFGKARFTDHDYELLRMCSKNGYVIRGGFSKILKYFRSNYSGSLMSYVDRDIGNGGAYVASGFSQCGLTKSGYCWTDGHKTISRFKAQKGQLGSWLKSFDPDKTEKENMVAAGFRQYWDCGNIVFEMI